MRLQRNWKGWKEKVNVLWNDSWAFQKLPLGSGYEDMKAAALFPVILPHDWLIENTDDLYESCDGWYVKTLKQGEWKAENDTLLSFDGVYMDADVLLDGQVILTHRYGYTAFFVNLTDYLTPGDHEIAVHIRHQSPNSRWYSGAGIFRDVRLLSLPRYHMVPDGFQVNTEMREGKWFLSLEAELTGKGDEMPEASLYDDQGSLLFREKMNPVPGGAALHVFPGDVKSWSPESPNLYQLVLALPGQEERIRVGFRETKLTPDQGLFLNGKPIKLFGVCLHHDLGALGSAFHLEAARRQLRVMREMGVNAIRTSHNPPARQFLDLCDEMGLLVDDELLDMWELPKTTYDNARFFPETYPKDVASWVRRDRCHPSVIFWSLGNEIYDMQVSQRGQMWTKVLADEVKKHDTRHAAVTFGSNYMPWEGAQKCADIIKIPGYNYAEKYYADHHQKHPDWVIYGSETGSLLASRGVYHFPLKESILSEADLQCSALLNSNTSWGAQDIRKLLVQDLNIPYSMGQFIWSGIDYIGEPTPYHTRNCYFGQADTACFPKDAYYFFQALWTEKPMIHIGVSWDWNKGQLIDVPVMTNGSEAELLINGRSLGRKKVDLRSEKDSLPLWQIPFCPGVLTARAYDEQGNLLCEASRETPGEAESLHIEAERVDLRAQCGDMAFLTVTARDAHGREVENAVNRVRVAVSGAGELLGLDNGDSTDLDPYQTFSRRLFSGKLLVIVGANDPGEIRVRVDADGLTGAEITLRVGEKPLGAETRRFMKLPLKPAAQEAEHIRRIDLKPLGNTLLNADRTSVSFEVTALPQNAMAQDIAFKVVNAQGVEMPCGKITREADGKVTVTALGDGSMYLRATANNGYSHPRVLSNIEVTAEGIGPMGLDPYGFIAGALASLKEGDVAAGNEQGIAFARDGASAAGFENVDFGKEGSNEITIPVFALDDALYEIKLWEGMPGSGGRLIAVLPYQKKSIWNVYQPETYVLPETLTGVRTIAFSMTEKIHLKGFSFTRQSRAFRYNRAVDADQLYGDSYRLEKDAVKNIGNNVTLRFTDVRFDKAGRYPLTLDGGTPLQINTVSLRLTNEEGESAVSTCDFTKSQREKQTFQVSAPKGLCTVDFVFLPGCQFDFYGFRFGDAE